jgi:hypothetical protein
LREIDAVAAVVEVRKPESSSLNSSASTRRGASYCTPFRRFMSGPVPPNDVDRQIRRPSRLPGSIRGDQVVASDRLSPNELGRTLLSQGGAYRDKHLVVNIRIRSLLRSFMKQTYHLQEYHCEDQICLIRGVGWTLLLPTSECQWVPHHVFDTSYLRTPVPETPSRTPGWP